MRLLHKNHQTNLTLSIEHQDTIMHPRDLAQLSYQFDTTNHEQRTYISIWWFITIMNNINIK